MKRDWNISSSDWILHLPTAANDIDKSIDLASRLDGAWTARKCHGVNIWINSKENINFNSDSGILFFVSEGRKRVCLEGLKKHNNVLSDEALDDVLQIFTSIQWSSSGDLSISTDLLGLSPVYILKTAGGVVVANKISSLIVLKPELCFDPDRTAILQYLYFLSPQGNKTLIRGIETMSVGKQLAWSVSKGIRESQHRQIKISQPNASYSLQEATDELYHLFIQSIENKFKHLADPIFIAMSGGFDSRLIAGALDRLNLDFSLYSYGSMHHEELHCAKALSERLGKKLNCLPPPRNVLNDGHQMFLKVLEGQVDPHIMHIKTLFRSKAPHGQPYGHGFLGDNISGGYLDNLGISSSTKLTELPSLYFK